MITTERLLCLRPVFYDKGEIPYTIWGPLYICNEMVEEDYCCVSCIIITVCLDDEDEIFGGRAYVLSMK